MSVMGVQQAKSYLGGARHRRLTKSFIGRTSAVWLAAAFGAAGAVTDAAGAQQASKPAASEMERAEQLMNVGRFREAEVLLRDKIGDAPGGSLGRTYLAITILRQEESRAWPSHVRLREAVKLSTRALKSAPQLLSARLTRARARMRLGEYESAKSDLNRVLDSLKATFAPPDSETMDRVKQLLERCEEKLRPWDLSFRLGTFYDTNVPQLGRNAGLPRIIGRERDWRLRAGFDFSYRILRNDRSELGVGGGALASWHADLDLFDEQTYHGSAYARHRLSDWLHVGIDYSYDYNLLGRQGYLSRHRLSPSVTFVGERSGATTVYYEFRDRRFFEAPAAFFSTEFDRSGQVQVVGASHTIALANLAAGTMYWHVGFRHENVSTRGTEYDARNQVLSSGLRVPIADGLAFDFLGEWAWENYKNRSMLDYRGRGRRDFVQSYQFGLTKEFNKNVSIRGEFLWIGDDSNVLTDHDDAVFSYDRVIYGVSLRIKL